MDKYTPGQRGPKKQSTDYITPFQKLEGKVLHFLTLLPEEQKESYMNYFGISKKRYGEIKQNESK